MISLSYLAFKALAGADGHLISPQQGTPWATDSQGRPVLVAAPGDIDQGNGVYAAIWQIAEEYGNSLYLVAPSAEGVEDDVVLADDGWRAASATVVGGPYTRSDAGVAAEIVLAAHHQGYPQLRTILRWAALMAQDAEAAIEALAGVDDGGYEPHRWTPALDRALRRAVDADLQAVLLRGTEQ